MSLMVQIVGCLLGMTLMTGCGGPSYEGSVSHGDQDSTWTMYASSHPAYVAPDDADIESYVEDAQYRWRNDADGDGKDNEQDVSVGVLFTYVAPCQSFPSPWAADKYNTISAPEDRDALMRADDIPQWILFVQEAPDDSGWGLTGAARVLLPDVCAREGAVYAHEFGHNSGLNHRYERSDDALSSHVSIMMDGSDAIPADDLQFANPDERDTMRRWTFTPP